MRIVLDLHIVDDLRQVRQFHTSSHLVQLCFTTSAVSASLIIVESNLIVESYPLNLSIHSHSH